jgi:hypothetical protein
MKTAHEILQEENMARLSAQEEERRWIRLRRECQSPAILGFTWLGVFLFMSLIAALWVVRAPGHWDRSLVGMFSPVLIMAPGVVLAYQRKQKALLKIIESEAPQLFQKLKTKGIA